MVTSPGVRPGTEMTEAERIVQKPCEDMYAEVLQDMRTDPQFKKFGADV